MKLFVIKALEVVSIIGFFLFIIGAGVAGYVGADVASYESEAQQALNPVIGALVGLFFGFIAAVVTFGMIFLVMDIADNTRRARELLQQRGGASS